MWDRDVRPCAGHLFGHQPNARRLASQCGVCRRWRRQLRRFFASAGSRAWAPWAEPSLAILGLDLPHPLDEIGDLRPVPFERDPLGGSRVFFAADARTPFGDRSNRARRKPAAAIGTDVAEDLVDAIGAEGALIAADPRIARLRRQVLVAPFAIRPELQHRFIP
jgi:hypothetical protein